MTILCPTCGMDTKLYLPPGFLPPETPPNAPALATLPHTVTTPRETLKAIRRNSCYNTLRGLINLVQALLFLAAVLIALAAIAQVVLPAPGSDPAPRTIELIAGLFSSVLLITLGIAAKQAVLLLVDIADCQIQQAATFQSTRQ